MSRIESKRVSLRLVAALVLASAGGCGLSKPYPDKSLHAISISQPPEKATTPGKHTVRINSVRIARPYDGTSFVYKVGDSKFTTDYYSGFIAAPAGLLTGELQAWLSGSGAFAAVVEGGITADYDMTLATDVISLYGDYSQGNSRQAVIEARFFLMDASGGGSRVIFQKTYREAEPLSADGPDALVKGWDAAYRRMLTSLTADLRGVQSASGASDNVGIVQPTRNAP